MSSMPSTSLQAAARLLDGKKDQRQVRIGEQLSTLPSGSCCGLQATSVLLQLPMLYLSAVTIQKTKGELHIRRTKEEFIHTMCPRVYRPTLSTD